MSVFGFSASKENGEVIVDSSAKGYGRVVDKTVTLPDVVLSGQAYQEVFATPWTCYDMPIIALPATPWDYLVYTAQMLGEPESWTGFRVLAGDARYGGWGGQNPHLPERDIRVRIYAPEIASSDSFGMRVIDEFGMIQFDSGWPQLEIKYAIGGSSGWHLVSTGSAISGQATYYIFANQQYLVPPTCWYSANIVDHSNLLSKSENQIRRYNNIGLTVDICFYNNRLSLIVVVDKIWQGSLEPSTLYLPSPVMVME